MKKRIITVLITILTVIPLVLITPKANTTQTSSNTITSYGNYTFRQGTSDSTFDFEMPLGEGGSFPINVTFNTGSWMSLDYQFNDKYSGTMKFSVTSSADWVLNSSNVYWAVTAEGAESTCYISATTTMSSVSRLKTFSVIFQNATAIHFTVVAPNNLNFFNSSQSITISNASFTSQPDMNDIYTDIHQLRLWWDLYIPGMSTNLGNIASSVSSILSDTSSISSDTSSILSTLSSFSSDLSLLKQYTDGVEGYIDDIEGYIDNLETQLSNITTIIRFQNINLFQLTALNLFNPNNSSYTPSYLYKNGFLYFWYDSSRNINSYNDSYAIKLPAHSQYILVLYSGQNLTSNNTKIYGSNSNVDLSGMVIQNNMFQSGNPYFKSVIYFENKSDNFIFVSLEFTVSMDIYPIWFGRSDNIPDDVSQLLGWNYSNTYTRLLQSINNGISTLNGDYDTSTYDSYEQTLDGLNDGLRSRFDNVDDTMQNNINTLFTPSGTAGSDGSIFEKFNFNGVNSLFTGILNGIFTSFPAFKYILLFALLLLVIGVMV